MAGSVAGTMQITREGGLVADSDDKEINCFIHANEHIKNISYSLDVAGIIPLALH